MKKKQFPAVIACTSPDLGTLFIPYLNQDVEADQKAAIEAHVSECPTCLEELLTMYELKRHWLSLHVRMPS